MAVAVSGIGIGTRCFRTRFQDHDGTRCASVIVLKLIRNSIKGKKNSFKIYFFYGKHASNTIDTLRAHCYNWATLCAWLVCMVKVVRWSLWGTVSVWHGYRKPARYTDMGTMGMDTDDLFRIHDHTHTLICCTCICHHGFDKLLWLGGFAFYLFHIFNSTISLIMYLNDIK